MVHANALKLEQLTVEAVHEASVNSYEADSDPHSAFSAGSFDGAVSSGSWRLTAQGDYLAASKRAARLTHNAIDIGQYAVGLSHSGNYGTAEARLGQQAFAGDDLLISQFNRRGASLGLRSGDSRFGAMAFAARVNDSIGADNFTGLNDSDDRVDGAVADYALLTGDDASLSLVASGYEGRGTGFGDTGIGDGHGYGAG